MGGDICRIADDGWGQKLPEWRPWSRRLYIYYFLNAITARVSPNLEFSRDRWHKKLAHSRFRAPSVNLPAKAPQIARLIKARGRTDRLGVSCYLYLASEILFQMPYTYVNYSWLPVTSSCDSRYRLRLLLSRVNYSFTG